MSLAVAVRDVVVRYGSVTALEHVSFALETGRALGIVGPNGSGKSTLLKAIAGLAPLQSGSIEVFGRPAGHLRPATIGYVPQIEEVDWSFPASVWDVVAMGRFPRMRVFARFSARDRQLVREALEAVGVERLADRRISQLSGGQQQRVFVARAIAQEPQLLLLDEPTTGVDAATEEALRKLVRGLVGKGMPVLMTTHDLDRAADWFDRLIVVDRHILADGDPETVLDSGAYAGIREHTHTHGHARSEPRAERVP